jgi:hypothetical protein
MRSEFFEQKRVCMQPPRIENEFLMEWKSIFEERQWLAAKKCAAPQAQPDLLETPEENYCSAPQ